MSDQILSEIEATVSDIQAITSALMSTATADLLGVQVQIATILAEAVGINANPSTRTPAEDDEWSDLYGKVEGLIDDLMPEIKIHPDADIDPIGTDAKAIREQMQRVDNDVNGNPRYVLHYLAFDNDYATAKEIAHSLGWSVYRAKSHGGCFVGQSYSTAESAERIAMSKAERAGGAQ